MNRIKNLEEKVNELKSMKNELLNPMEIDDELEEELQDWGTRADELVKAAESVIQSSSTLNLFHQLSKQVKQSSEEIAEHLTQFAKFNLPVKVFVDFGSREEAMKKIKEVMQSSSINSVGVLGEPGIGKSMLLEEVRRIVKQEFMFDVVIMIRVTMNPDPDLKKIQCELARGLDLDLPHKVTPWVAAGQIKSSLKNKKALIILDDLEPNIDLVELGIPLVDEQAGESSGDYKYCKILLASRDETVLSRHLNEANIFKLNLIEYQEAWNLFKKIAGAEAAENPLLQPIPENIARKSELLPLAVTSLANTLKTRTPQQWRDAKQEIDHDEERQRPGENHCSSLYSAIQLRCSDLPKKLRDTLLVCGLVCRNASIKDLLKYGVGLELFPEENSMEEARCETVPAFVSRLRNSNFLLDGHCSMPLDMHFLIQEVIISIASKDHNKLVLRKGDTLNGNERDEETLKKLKWVCILGGDTTPLQSYQLKAPNLSFFYLSSDNQPPLDGIPDNLFKGTRGLRVLGLTRTRFSSFPSSVSGLLNLHTLCLDQSVFGDLDIGPIIGALESLQALSLAGCDIQTLPVKIGNLIELKLLDLSDCQKLTSIPPGILSSLTKLEELYLGNSFDLWEVGTNASDGLPSWEVETNGLDQQSEEVDTNASLGLQSWEVEKNGLDQQSEEVEANEGFDWDRSLLEKDSSLNSEMSERNASLDELKELHNLTVLEVCIASINNIPNGLFCIGLEQYKILIGDVWSWGSPSENTKILKLKLNDKFDHSILTLISKSDELYLEDLDGVQTAINELDYSGFQELKYLHVKNAKAIKYMIRWISRRSTVFPNLEEIFLLNLENLERISYKQYEARCFIKLRVIIVKCCNQLKNLFYFSMAKKLHQLQEITVEECKNIAEIIDGTHEVGDEDGITERGGDLFGKLWFLRLHNLPKLNSFFRGKNTSSWDNSKKVLFPHFQEQSFIGFRAKSYDFGKLKKLIVEGCHNLEYLCASFVVTCLVELKHLEIRECQRMKVIVEGENVRTTINSKLNFLQIEGLQNLIGFCSGNWSVDFPSLKQLAIENCPKLKEFVVTRSPASTETGITDNKTLFSDKIKIPELERMSLSGLENLEIIWSKLFTGSFEKLKSLRVTSCKKLKTIFPSDKFFKSLEMLEITGCDAVKEVFRGEESNTADLQDSKLRELFIYDLPVLEKIWHSLPACSFEKLKSLTVRKCENLDTIFPSGTLIKSLEMLEITACDSVKEVFQLEPLNTTELHAFQLEKLFVYDLQALEHIWKMDSSTRVITFKKLLSVTVSGCSNLKYLFPLSLAESPGLSELKELEIQYSGLRKIVATREDTQAAKFEFNSLTCLTLNFLTQLVSFYPAHYTMSWPKLEKLYFCRDGDLRNNELQVLRVEEVIPNLKELSLTGKDIAMLCQNQPQLVAENLKVFRVQHQDPKFPISFLQGLRNLNELLVEDSDLHQLISTNDTVLSRIRILKLKSLPNLQSICSQEASVFQSLNRLKVLDCNSFFTMKASFEELTHMDIGNCQNIEKLFSVPAARSLKKLELLSIRECHKLIKIIDDDSEGTAETINFEKLRIVRLECLTSLTCFCSSTCTFEFPLLEQVIVNQCQRMNNFCMGRLVAPKMKKVQLVEGKVEWHWDGDLEGTIRNLRKKEVECSKLKYLELYGSSTSIRSWNSNTEMSFKQLTSLDFCKVDLLYLFTPSMAKGLSVLTKLTVRHCNMMEGIIMQQKEEEVPELLIFEKLEYITLESCFDLKSFSAGSFSLSFPSLKNAVVQNCSNAAEFALTVSTDQRNQASNHFFNNKVKFLSLELKIVLSSVKIQRMWPNQPDWKTSFLGSLTSLEVHGCDQLTYLMEFSAVKSLVKLKKISIRNCKLMEVIIKTEENVELVQTDPLFPVLSRIELEDLPELTGFCSQSHSIEEANLFQFPRLEELRFSKLPKLNSFNYYDPAEERGYVNGNNRFQVQAQQFLPQVNEVEFSSVQLEISVQMWRNVPDAMASFVGRLTLLTVQGCDQLEYLMTLSMVGCFVQLQGMVIHHCSNMKEIIKIEDHVEGEGRNVTLFPELRSINIEDLPELTGFCSQSSLMEEAIVFEFPGVTELMFSNIPKLKNLLPWHSQDKDQEQQVADHFQPGPIPPLRPALVFKFVNLIKLEVSKCHGLTSLLRYSDAEHLGQLSTLTITECSSLREIVTWERDEVEDAIVFPDLRNVNLRCVHKLASVSSGNSELKFPDSTVWNSEECASSEGDVEMEVDEYDAEIEEWNLESTGQYVSNIYEGGAAAGHGIPRIDIIVFRFMVLLILSICVMELGPKLLQLIRTKW